MNRLTSKDHKSLGKILKKARMDLIKQLSGKKASDPEGKKLNAGIREIDRLKCILDNVACQRWPKNDEVLKYYYGSPED